jgi:hypothetical protein
MIERGSPVDGVLTRIDNMMEQAKVSTDSSIDLLRTKAADPRPGMRLLAKALRDLAGEANYQAERLENVLAQYERQHHG